MQSRIITATTRRIHVPGGAFSAITSGSRTYASSNSRLEDSLTPKNDSISQGHAASSKSKAKHSNIQSDMVSDANKARNDSSNVSPDAASPNIRPNPKDKTKGNPEGVGMVDQVGSASGSSDAFDKGKQGTRK